MIHVRFRLLTGKNVYLDINKDCTIGDLKVKISETEKREQENANVLFCGNVYDDDFNISNLQLNNDSYFVVIWRKNKKKKAIKKKKRLIEPNSTTKSTPSVSSDPPKTIPFNMFAAQGTSASASKPSKGTPASKNLLPSEQFLVGASRGLSDVFSDKYEDPKGTSNLYEGVESFDELNRRSHVDMVKLLDDYPVTIFPGAVPKREFLLSKLSPQMNEFLDCCFNDDLKMAKELLSEGADSEAEFKFQTPLGVMYFSPIVLASANCSSGVVRLLLKDAVEPRRIVLENACYFNNMELLRIVEEDGRLMTEENVYEAAMVAAEEGHFEIVKMLMENYWSIDPNGIMGKYIGDETIRSLSKEADELVGKHWGVKCDGCGKTDWKGARLKCQECEDFDLCLTCADDSEKYHKDKDHKFEQVSPLFRDEDDFVKHALRSLRKGEFYRPLKFEEMGEEEEEEEEEIEETGEIDKDGEDPSENELLGFMTNFIKYTEEDRKQELKRELKIASEERKKRKTGLGGRRVVQSILLFAIERGDVEFVKFLVERKIIGKANPSANGHTPLRRACEKGNFEIIKALLEISTLGVGNTLSYNEEGEIRDIITLVHLHGHDHVDAVVYLMDAFDRGDNRIYSSSLFVKAVSMDEEEIVKAFLRSTTFLSEKEKKCYQIARSRGWIQPFLASSTASWEEIKELRKRYRDQYKL